MNLIPEGALHARKHDIVSSDPELEGQITTKGIPVISKSGGEITQHAEIEREE
jgi:rRNA-processing protein FCF1